MEFWETRGKRGNGKRVPIVDLMPVQQIHPEIKRQHECSHIDSDEKLFLLMQESYSSTYDIMISQTITKRWS